MGQIVGAFATVHAPQLFTRPPTEVPEQLDADIAAMKLMGKELDELKPDAVIVIGSDHLETFFLSSVPDVRRDRGRNVQGALRHQELRDEGAPAAGRGHARQAGARRVRHGLFAGCAAGPQLRGRVRVDHRRPRHPRGAGFRQCLSAASALAAPLPCAGQGDRRHYQEPAGARRDRRQRRHVALSRHLEVSAARLRFRLLGHRADGARQPRSDSRI